MTPPPLVLASTSPYRRELLERLGVPFSAAAPDCDEDAFKLGRDSAVAGPFKLGRDSAVAGPFKARSRSPRGLAEALALAKAESLRAAHPGAAILGGDQVATIDGEILGKPGTRAAAVAQLERLAGREHLLITAVALLHGGRVLRHTDVARLTLRPLTRAQIERYVAADDPVDCAGSYKLERRGIALFAAIDAADHTAITGLPLIWLAGALAGLGFEVP